MGQIRNTAALCLGKDLRFPTEEEAGWAPELGFPVRSLLSALTTIFNSKKKILHILKFWMFAQSESVS